jgi:pimeloyl-ACP methyl ester carboxylesterase
MVLSTVARTVHRHVVVGDVRISYRESVPVGNPSEAPVMLLLHGFPLASHEFRRLTEMPGLYYRLLAPDYPGLGYSDVPLSTSGGGTFRYSFDKLAMS